jgi:hypothetical protein
VVDNTHCRGVNKVILEWQKPLWEGDQEVVKRSGKEEPMWVAIHMCMEAMLGISLYSSLSQTSKNTMSFLLSLMFSLQQNWRRGRNQILPGSRVVVGGRRWPKQCIHVSKCKNVKIKERNAADLALCS